MLSWSLQWLARAACARPRRLRRGEGRLAGLVLRPVARRDRATTAPTACARSSTRCWRGSASSRALCFVDAQGVYHGLPATGDRGDLPHRRSIRRQRHARGLAGGGVARGIDGLVDGEPGCTPDEDGASPRWRARRRPTTTTTSRRARTSARPRAPRPTAGQDWRPRLSRSSPICSTRWTPARADDAPFTTVMNWQRPRRGRVRGRRSYGQKDVEFERFLDLPRSRLVGASRWPSRARRAPRRLEEAGWRVRDAHEVTRPSTRTGATSQASAGRVQRLQERLRRDEQRVVQRPERRLPRARAARSSCRTPASARTCRAARACSPSATSTRPPMRSRASSATASGTHAPRARSRASTSTGGR